MSTRNRSLDSEFSRRAWATLTRRSLLWKDSHSGRKQTQPTLPSARRTSDLGVLLAREKQEFESAIASYQKVAEDHERYENTQFNLGVLLSERQEDYDAAIDCYRQCITVNPRHEGAHFNLARLLDTAKGDF